MQLNKCKFKEYIQKNKCLCEECKGMEYVNIKEVKNAYMALGILLGQASCILAYLLKIYFID